MKRYHVSKNLINYTQSESGGIDASGNYLDSPLLWRSTVYTAIDNTENYTISFEQITNLSKVRINYFTSNNTHIERQEIDALSVNNAQLSIPNNAAFIKWTLYSTTTINISFVASIKIMLNEGSSALPYEPYGNEWQTKSPPNYGTGTDTVTSLPVTLYTDGQPIAANLFDKDNATIYQAYLTDTQWLWSEDSASVKIPCLPNTTYTISVATSLPIFRIATSDDENIQPQNLINIVVRSAYETQHTFTTSSTAQAIIFQGSKSMVDTWLAELMVNTGSTALPYQPYAPWVMKGNTETSGTPSPSNPVTINGTGNKTANLLPPPTAAASGEINGITYNVSADGVCTFSGTASASVNITVNLSKQFVIPYSAPAGGQGTVAFNNSKALNAVVMFYNGNTQVDAWQLNVVNRTHSSYSGMAGKTIDRYIIQIPSGVNADGLTVAVAFSDNGVPVSPFEPYGKYKVSITSNGTTLSPVYLTEQLMKIGDTVDSLVSSGTVTYNIVKYEFKGNENITKVNSTATNYLYYVVLTDTVIGGGMCSHLQYLSSGVSDNIGFSQNQTYPNTFYFNLGADIMNAQTSGNTAEGFKEWLAAQYAAGTPLTLWRILATPTTESVTAPSIPTTGGTATIDVDTTVKPSELDLTYHGWHTHQPKKKSANLFDKSILLNGKGLDVDGSIIDNTRRCTTGTPIDVSATNDVTITFDSIIATTRIIYCLFNGSTLIRRVTSISSGETIDTSEGNSLYICFYDTTLVGTITSNDLSNIMLNTGQTALPYEPYWK